MSAPFTVLCRDSVYPLFLTLYKLSRNDSKEAVLNTMLYNCNQYLESNGREFTDLYLKEEIRHFMSQWKAYEIKGGIPRKNLDHHLYKLLYCMADMLVSHNSIFPIEAIYNGVGRVRDHYTAK